MGTDEGWGREQGRTIYQRLISVVEDNPGIPIFRVSLNGVNRVDASFASETVVEIARRYRTDRGFCFVDMPSLNQAENWDAAALKKEQPLMLWQDGLTILGPAPSAGVKAAFEFALERESVRASVFSDAADVKITGASAKYKQLWQQGYLLRREGVQKSGGVEFVYFRIK